MSLLAVVITLVFIGLILWAVNKWIPLEPWIKKTINIVIAVAVVIWLLRVFGVWGYVDKIKI